MLHDGLSALDAFRVIARDCLQRLEDQAQQFGDIGGAEVLHQCRVAIRQIRTALRLFRPLLNAAAVARFDRELHWIARQLADARELDVLLARPLEGQDSSTSLLLDRLLLVKEAAYGQANVAITSHRMQQLLAEMNAWIGRDIMSAAASEEPIRSFARRALNKSRRKVVQCAGIRFARMTSQDLHRLRIAVKNLRYAENFFAPLHGYEDKASARLRKRLARAQDVLGEIHDLAMAKGLIGSVGLAPREDNAAIRLLDKAAKGRRKQLRKNRKRLRKLRTI